MIGRKQRTGLPDIIDIEVGIKMRSRRRELGISQKTLAERVGITFQQIQKYEKGKNRVGASRLLQIADILTVSASFFFHNETQTVVKGRDVDERHPYADLLSFLETSDGSTLNMAFAKIKSPAVRARIVALVKTIAEANAKSSCRKD